MGSLITANMILSWFFRDVTDDLARKAISYQQMFAWFATFVIFVWGQLAGVFNLLGWSNILLSAIYVVAWGYYAFIYPAQEGKGASALQA